jgi:hypothetical protein
MEGPMTRFRTLLIAAAIVALGTPASAQDMMTEAVKHQRGAQKQVEKPKKKVDEKAYDAALKSIPDSTKKTDPWGNLR